MIFIVLIFIAQQLIIDANRALYGCLHANRVTQHEGSRVLRLMGGPGGVKTAEGETFKGISALDTVISVLVGQHRMVPKVQLWCLKVIACIVGGELQVRVLFLARV